MDTNSTAPVAVVGGGTSAISGGIIYAGGSRATWRRTFVAALLPRQRSADRVDARPRRRVRRRAVSVPHQLPAHRVVGKGYTGQRLWETLFTAARRLGVRFEIASKVETLLFDAEGRVNGVAYRAFALEDGGGVRGRGRGLAKHLHRALTRLAERLRQVSMHSAAAWIERQAHAIWDRYAVSKTLRGRSVILAAGGFVMNASMMQHGILLDMSAGDVVSHMDQLSIWRLMYPPEALLEGAVVSAGGERVAAEDLYGASFSHVLIRQQTQMPWTLLVRYLVHWHHKKAHSIGALAAKLGLALADCVFSGMRARQHAANRLLDAKAPGQR
ncbi:hypothetical protein F5Y10DRAFT_273039 [Nemania abortiva]|nr:hypothetical protein F5Y10DRAFT_273039 [Nemania abortiva]